MAESGELAAALASAAGAFAGADVASSFAQDVSVTRSAATSDSVIQFVMCVSLREGVIEDSVKGESNERNDGLEIHPHEMDAQQLRDR